MKMKNGIEQGICILAMLSIQNKNIPIASEVFSERLNVSPSYLKKIMRKLVVHRLIQSVPGTKGGFSLSKAPADLNALDLFLAIEGEESFLEVDGLIESVFPESNVSKKGEKVLMDSFQRAQEHYFDELKKITMENLLEKTVGSKKFQLVDWNQNPSREYLEEIQRMLH